MRKSLLALLTILTTLFISPAWAGFTFVTVETNLGAFTLELNGDKAPITVANFLTYLGEGFYQDTIFHRSPKNFVVQGGGFDRAASFTSPTQKPTHPAIVLESNNGLSNLRGTIAMARTNVANSATSQFYINVVDNKFLDYASSASPGYAVFGKVVDGMAVVDAINALPVAKNIIKGASTVFQDMPILDSQSTPPVPVYVKGMSLPLPVANAGQDFTVESGTAVTLDGSASNDSTPGQTQPLTYQWTQTAGPAVTFSGGANVAKPSFTAPTVAADTVLSFQLVVTNGSGNASAAPATVNITVKALAPPAADAGQDFAVESGSVVTLDGSASRNQNPADRSPLVYQWTQTAGPTVDLSGVSNQARPLFTAPTVAADTVLSFQVVVTSASGQASASPDSVNVTVKAPVSQPKDPNLPDCSGAIPSRDSLWPAKAGWVAVAIGGIQGPAQFALKIDRVLSDEPVKHKATKDTTGPDAKIRRGKA
ncbi:peptidylprolyl isomerase, partial [Methylomagnum sp.]